MVNLDIVGVRPGLAVVGTLPRARGRSAFVILCNILAVALQHDFSGIALARLSDPVWKLVSIVAVI